MIIKKDQDNTDLDKCLYIAIERVGALEEDDSQFNNFNSKKYSFIILGSSGGRIDHTFSTYHHVFKYLNCYSEQLSDTEIFMFSKSSMSVFLKNGVNYIDSSEIIQNKIFGYSIVPIYGEANVKVSDNTNNFLDSKGFLFSYFLELFLKFGENVFFFKKNLPEKIKLIVDNDKAALLYTCTTLYYNKY